MALDEADLDAFLDAPDDITGVATTFGYNDPEDNGMGKWGDPTNNPDIVGVSVPKSIAAAQFGNPDLAHNELVEAYNPRTGQSIRAPIVDQGPSERLLAEGRVIDLTEGARRELGMTGKDPVSYRFVQKPFKSEAEIDAFLDAPPEPVKPFNSESEIDAFLDAPDPAIQTKAAVHDLKADLDTANKGLALQDAFPRIPEKQPEPPKLEPKLSLWSRFTKWMDGSGFDDPARAKAINELGEKIIADNPDAYTYAAEIMAGKRSPLVDPDAPVLHAPETAADKEALERHPIAAGIVKGAVGALESFTSPRSIEIFLGLSMLPVGIQKAAGLAFAGLGERELYHATKKLTESVMDDDRAGMAEGAGGMVASFVPIALAAHMVAPNKVTPEARANAVRELEAWVEQRKADAELQRQIEVLPEKNAGETATALAESLSTGAPPVEFRPATQELPPPAVLEPRPEPPAAPPVAPVAAPEPAPRVETAEPWREFQEGKTYRVTRQIAVPARDSEGRLTGYYDQQTTTADILIQKETPKFVVTDKGKVAKHTLLERKLMETAAEPTRKPERRTQVSAAAKSVLEPFGSVISGFAHGKETVRATVQDVARTKRGTSIDASILDSDSGKIRVILHSRNDVGGLVDAAALLRKEGDSYVVENIANAETIQGAIPALRKAILENLGRVVRDESAPTSKPVAAEPAKPSPEPAPQLTPESVTAQSRQIEQIVSEGVNSGKDRLEVQQKAEAMVLDANLKGNPINWTLVREQSLGAPTQKRGGGKQESMDAPEAAQVAVEGRGPDVETQITELRKSVTKLKPTERKVVEGMMDGKTNAELARELGLSTGKVKALYDKGLTQLRKEMVDVVPPHLKPSKGVRDILDSQPETPAPETPLPPFPKGFKLKGKDGGFVNGDVLLEIGQAVAKTAKDFTAWSKEMIRRVGDAIKPHLDALWKSVSGQNLLPGSREGGAWGSSGGKRKAPIGDTPRGDKNWLKIPAWYKRPGIATEGARGILIRTKNQVGIELAKATRKQVDVEQELFGQHDKMLRDGVKGIPSKRLDAAMAEVAGYIRDVENKRPATPLSPDAQGILDSWYEVGESTGNIARANGVQVFDSTLGKYRPIGHVRNYIPRMFSKEVEAALRDPDANQPMFDSLAQAIATHKGITVEAAAAELNGVAGRFTANDFHANLELARTEQLPEIFYEYDLRNLAARYLPAYSERMAQIIAYGQRLGPRDAPQRMNLWDIARKESRDKATQQWLNEAEDQSIGFKPAKPGIAIARRAQAIGNATLLSDPTTTVVRNLLSGLSVTTERFGIGRSLRQLVAAGKSASRMDARQIGAVRDDIGSFLGIDQLGETTLDTAARVFQREMLEKSGFSGSETFVRTHNALVASTFARDAAASLGKNPKAALSREALAQFKRWDVDPELIVSEGGNWKTGSETRKFIRTAVRESQGGYRFDQVPLWAGTTTGRFVYQYGRWGIQRAGDILKNTIRPAIGETVEFRGVKMTRRNVLPLMRLGLFTVGLGETFAAVASLLFDRDRRDASFSEIGEAYNEDELRAVGMFGERIVNDVIMAGTLGLIGQPVDFIKSMKDQTRFKNPLDPPSIAGVKALADLAKKAKDQGGSLTKRDLLGAATSLVRGPKNVTDVARNALDEKLYEAQNDQRTLRNAARRWAKAQGMDVAPKGGFESMRKSPNAPVFEAVNDALLTGNAAKAKQVAEAFVEQSKDKEKAFESIKSSVEGKHPFRAGPFTADKYEQAFMEWAQKYMSPEDLGQIKRVIETYDKTAREANLAGNPPAKSDSRTLSRTLSTRTLDRN